MHSYLPGGVLDKFVAEYLRSDRRGEPDGPEPNGRAELTPHRNAKTVYEHRYLDHRIIAKVYDDNQDGVSAYQVWHALWTHGFGPGSIHRIPEPSSPPRAADLLDGTGGRHVPAPTRLA